MVANARLTAGLFCVVEQATLRSLAVSGSSCARTEPGGGNMSPIARSVTGLRGRAVLLSLALLFTAGADRAGRISAPIQIATAPTVQSDATAAAIDLASYEKLYGVDEEAATAQVGETAAISALQTALATSYPRSFAGLWVDHDPYSINVAFTAGTDATGVAALVKAAGLETTPIVKSVPYSLSDLNQVVTSLQGLGIKADLNIDIRENQVEVNVTDAVSATSAIANASVDTNAVTVEQVPSLAQPTTTIYGGLGGSNTNQQWQGCPSGFDVQQRVGGPDDLIYGFITAGHCTNTMSYMGVTLPYVASCYQLGCDSQFHTQASFAVSPRFYSHPGTLSYVTSTTGWISEYVGETVCKFGEYTGYACGTISSKSEVPGYVPHARAEFTLVTNNCTSDLVHGGDSGSPVFYGTSAFGIISGQTNELSCITHQELIFDAIDLATNSYSGMSVMLH